MTASQHHAKLMSHEGGNWRVGISDSPKPRARSVMMSDSAASQEKMTDGIGNDQFDGIMRVYSI